MGQPPEVIYLDTCVAIWCGGGETHRLSKRASAAINEAKSILISPFVILELEYLYEVEVLQIGGKELSSYLGAVIGLQVCSLPMPMIVDEAARVKWTRDPFDRMIVAQAQAAGAAPLITSDRRIRRNYSNAWWE